MCPCPFVARLSKWRQVRPVNRRAREARVTCPPYPTRQRTTPYASLAPRTPHANGQRRTRHLPPVPHTPTDSAVRVTCPPYPTRQLAPRTPHVPPPTRPDTSIHSAVRVTYRPYPTRQRTAPYMSLAPRTPHANGQRRTRPLPPRIRHANGQRRTRHLRLDEARGNKASPTSPTNAGALFDVLASTQCALSARLYFTT